MHTNNEILVNIYDRNAASMENVAHFYRWVMEIFSQYEVPVNASIIDIGCGTGAVLEYLRDKGYQSLTGVDFSQGCLRLAKERNLLARLYRQDIVEEPIAGAYDVAIMTTVIDFVEDPNTALNNVLAGLKEQGLFFISIRNLTAYFPWYHLGFFANSLRRWPRARHWFLQFTTPLSWRRNEYPVDEMFTTSQARVMLHNAGLAIVGEHSAQFLPMFWIWDVPQLVAAMKWIDKHFPSPKRLGYMYMFVCQKGPS